MLPSDKRFPAPPPRHDSLRKCEIDPFVKESSMLTKPPSKFTFDMQFLSQAQPISNPPINPNAFNYNPTYFEDEATESSFSSESKRRSRRPPPPPPAHGRARHFSLPPIPIPTNLSPLAASAVDTVARTPHGEAEADVFLPSSPATDTHLRIPTPLSKHGKRGSAFGRFADFFWKSKPCTASVGSGSVVSVGSSGISSPPFSPDSSIYTNSLDSDSHSSSHSHPSTNSDQSHYPDLHFYQPMMRKHDEEGDDHDLDVFPIQPTYYNQKRSSHSRNHSVPSAPTSNHLPSQQSYYNTQSFHTFSRPNVRRHSTSSESKSPPPIALRKDAHSYTNLKSRDPSGDSGYLVPIQTRGNECMSPQKGQVQGSYLNELPFSNGLHGSSSGEGEVVQVEVHTPTSSQTYSDIFSSSSASTAIPQSVYFPPTAPHALRRQPCSSDSSSTIEPPTTNNSGESRGHATTIRMNQAEAECGLYCTFCSTHPRTTHSATRSRKMSVGILSSHDCFFSQRAEGQLRKVFETIAGSDRRKLNVTLESFDLREMHEDAKAMDLHRAKVQVIIISHHFLDRLRHETNVQKRVSPINRILRAKRVIAILLSGVGSGGATDNQDVAEGFQQYLLQFAEWETLELKPSSKLETGFYRKFTEKVIHIYNLEQRPPVGFSIFPKKVSKFQPKVVLFLKKALETEDRLSVELRRGREKEHVQEVHLVNPYSGIIQLPGSLFEEDRSSIIEISVVVNEEKLGSKVFKYDHTSSHICEEEVPIVTEDSEHEDPSPQPISESQDSNPSSSETTTSEYYDHPRPSRQDYCIPPPARPVVPQKPKKRTPSQPSTDTSCVDKSTTPNSSSIDNDDKAVAPPLPPYSNLTPLNQAKIN